MNNFFLSLTQKLPKRIKAKFGIEKKVKRRQSVKLSCLNEQLLSKFEATLLVGDCLGRRFEGIWGPNLTEMLDDYRMQKEKYAEYENDVDLESLISTSHIEQFTDDTALTRAICSSIISHDEICVEDIANRFQNTYIREPNRGYASGAVSLFKRLSTLKKTNELQSKCFTPAMELFNGEGSYGNGAGMRCSPIALFTFAKSLDEMKLNCDLVTRLTHTHIWAVIGALQQCYAIRQALHSNRSPQSFDFDSFYINIITFVSELELNFQQSDQIYYENLDKYPKNMQKNFLLYLEQKIQLFNSRAGSTPTNANLINEYFQQLQLNQQQKHKPKINTTYSTLLKRILKMIQKCRKGEKLNLERLYRQVVNCGVSSIQTIPMALLAFMIASDPKCVNEVNFKLNSADAFKEYNSIERVIFYAISLGGDTNTISSLAGAIAGAFFGRKELPRYLIEMCEANKETLLYAQKLFDLSIPHEPNNNNSNHSIILEDDLKLNNGSLHQFNVTLPIYQSSSYNVASLAHQP